MPRYARIRQEEVVKKKKQEKPFFSTFIKFALIAVFAIIVATIYHADKLGKEVEEKFNKPEKWNLPSRIYSDAEHIYPGYNIVQKGLISKLDRLGYRGMQERVASPGEYFAYENIIEIFLHDFDYPEEKLKGYPVRLDLNSNAISKITRLDDSSDLSVIKLEPELIASLFDQSMEDRTLVNLNDVPQYLLEAIILIEDERFFKHHGVDPYGIIRAMAANITAGSIVQGGSTLTQQLVKNFFLHPRKSFIRKFNEIIMAIQLERKHSKAEILQAYVNEIYLGQRGASSVSGIAEACRLYFGKDVKQISIAESAQLAGMIKSPYKYNSFVNPKSAKERRDFVLKRMMDSDLITKQEYEKAVADQIITPKLKLRGNSAPYFVDFLKQQLNQLYPEDVLQSEGLRIFTTLDMGAQLAAERSVADGLNELEKKFSWKLPKGYEGNLESCLVAISPSNGYIRALVGGRDYSVSQFNRCTQAQRQPGSAFKPFVYLTAFDPNRSNKQFTPSSLIDDTSFEIEAGGKMWSPKNYDNEQHGTVTLMTALENSYNIATAKLALEVGLEEIVQTARDAGIKSRLSPVPSIALGSFETSPLELASAYSIFPNEGIRAEPISVMHVVTKDGKILERKPLSMKRQFDSAPVFITTQAMKGVLERGTARSAKFMGIGDNAAGKTGTSSDYKDGWFVGFTQNMVALAWIGFDDNTSMGMSGATVALPLWSSFMKETTTFEDRFDLPKGVVMVKVDPVSGLISNENCPAFAQEAYIEGTEPKEECK